MFDEISKYKNNVGRMQRDRLLKLLKTANPREKGTENDLRIDCWKIMAETGQQ
jgi:hypothetical protein